MKSKIIIPVLALATLIFSSCGTNKKVEAANARTADMEAQNKQLASKNNNLQRQVSDLTAQNQSLTQQYNNYQKDCENCQKQLKEVNTAMNQLNADIEELQKKIEQAEAEFADKGLDVYSKDGVIFVDMRDNLLYKSGSAKLSDDGKKALGNLADVINQFPELKVIVVGNTDTMHVKGVADNWSLSTERANGVVRTLVKDYQVEPLRLTAAGKGKFNPVADNSTEEGRAKNRRTEIVLNPNWEKLWESIRNKE